MPPHAGRSKGKRPAHNPPSLDGNDGPNALNLLPCSQCSFQAPNHKSLLYHVSRCVSYKNRETDRDALSTPSTIPSPSPPQPSLANPRAPEEMSELEYVSDSQEVPAHQPWSDHDVRTLDDDEGTPRLPDSNGRDHPFRRHTSDPIRFEDAPELPEQHAEARGATSPDSDAELNPEASQGPPPEPRSRGHAAQDDEEHAAPPVVAEAIVPWTKHMKQDADMASFGIVAHEDIHILTCVKCKTAIDPHAIRRHVRKDIPHAKITEDYCSQLRQRYALLEKGRILPPTTLRAAIPNLEIRHGYWHCPVCLRAVKNRHTLVTRHKSCGAVTPVRGPAQAYFPSAHQGGFFAVAMPMLPPTDDGIDIVAGFKSKYPDPIPADVLIMANPDPRDTNHFLSKRDWMLVVAGHTGRQVRHAVRGCNLPLRAVISDSVKGYMDEVDRDLRERKNYAAEVAIGSYHGEMCTTDRFTHLENAKSRAEYTNLGIDMVAFVVAAARECLPEGFGFELPDRQRKDAVAYHVAVESGSGQEKTALQDLLYSMFTQNVREKDVKDLAVYRFLIFCAFREDGSLDICNNITRIISKIVFFARASIYNRIRAEMDANGEGFFGVFQYYRKYVLLQSDYPLCTLYNDRNLLKTMTEDEARQPKVSLTGEDNRTAVVDGIAVGLDGIGDMFRGLLQDIEERERTITLGLSDSDPRFRITVPDLFVDQCNRRDVDFFFADVPSNGFSELRDLMLRVLIDEPAFRNRCFVRTGPSEVRINAAGCHKFLEQCADLRLLLFSAMHISSGSPGRGSEIAAQCLRNIPGGDIRNVQVVLGRLCFVGTYNKTSHQTIHSKAIFRYPPRALVPYLLREWLVYRPAQVYIARALRLHDVARALRYEAFPGLYRRLDSADLSDALRASTFKYLGYEVGLRYWRDIQVHFTQRFAEYEEGGESTQAIYAQRGHSREAGYRHYATPTDAPAGVPYGVMKAQLGASRFWQDLTGIEAFTPAERERCGAGPRDVSTLLEALTVEVRANTEATTALANRVDAMPPPPGGPPPPVPEQAPGVGAPPPPRPSSRPELLPHPSVLRLLRSFLNDQNATFTCAEQAQALQLALARRGSVFLIGPTGMGKTSVFLIPASENRHMTTVVLIPLSSLRTDFVLRCRRKNIPCELWKGREQEPAAVVVVSPEQATYAAFSAWLANLRHREMLNLFIVDEAHLFVTQRKFRDCFSSLKGLVGAVGGVPFLLMTATCPVNLEREILGTLALTQCRVVRAMTPRPEISYNVTVFGSQAEALAALELEVPSALGGYQEGEKAFIYCRGVDTVKRVARLVGCEPFHAQVDNEERDEIWTQFLANPAKKLLVSTCVLGAGVDVPHVRNVWHFGLPWSMIEYAQETGRAGRDGLNSRSHLLTWSSELARNPQGPAETEHELREWVPRRDECRRIGIGAVLDERPTSCVLLRDGNLCDYCRREVMGPAPERVDPVPSTSARISTLPAREPEPSIPKPARARADIAAKAPHRRLGGSQGTEPGRGTAREPDPPSTVRASPPLSRRTPMTQEPSDRPTKKQRSTRPDPLMEIDEMKGSIEASLRKRARTGPKGVNQGKDGDGHEFEVGRRLATTVVEQVRAALGRMARSSIDQECTVCWSISGEKYLGHRAGNDCPRGLCSDSDGEWSTFQAKFRFRKGYLCWYCLLPTAAKKNAPGAKPHPFDQCVLQHMIRPALYAFWGRAPAPLRQFVADAINVRWANRDAFIAWCVGTDVGIDLPNHLLLFWWIARFWEAQEE